MTYVSVRVPFLPLSPYLIVSPLSPSPQVPTSLPFSQVLSYTSLSDTLFSAYADLFPLSCLVPSMCVSQPQTPNPHAPIPTHTTPASRSSCGVQRRSTAVSRATLSTRLSLRPDPEARSLSLNLPLGAPRFRPASSLSPGSPSGPEGSPDTALVILARSFRYCNADKII